MDRFIKASTDYATDLGESLTEEFTKIRTDYKAAFVLQKGLLGSIKTNTTAYYQKKEELLDLLYRDSLFIAAHYFKTPENMLSFFDESLLEVKRHKPEDGGVAPRTFEVNPNSTLTLDVVYTPTNTLLISNVSKQVSVFISRPTLQMPCRMIIFRN